MNDHTASDFSDVPTDVMLRANRQCNALESAWKTGPTPRIEDFIHDLPIAAHPELLWELILVDWEYRRRLGETPDVAEYAARFPQIDPVWFQQAARENPPETPVLDFAGRSRIGEYVLLKEIGAGGMGTVWKARHRQLDRIFAVKFLPQHLAANGKLLRRFYREIKAAAKLQHPNIVAAYDAGEDDGAPYLVMEFVDGDNLSRLIAINGTRTTEQAIDIILQAAEGLRYAHDQGVVHRDVKPSNLLIDTQGAIKILDLGLARVREALTPMPDNDATGVTASKEIVGTPNYMAPEQAIDAHAADHRADIYGLGCTLFFLLTGESLFPRNSLLDTILAHRLESPRSLCTLSSSTPKVLDQIFQKMVAKNPSERIQSMAEVVAQLQRVSGATPSRARSRRWWIHVILLLAAMLLIGGMITFFRPFFPITDNDPHSEKPLLAPRTFSRADAKSYQSAWAQYLETNVTIRNSHNMNMVLIPPGRFDMGATEKTIKWLVRNKHPNSQIQSETPQHRVHITRPFRISATEVTIGQFRKFGERYKTAAERKGGQAWGMIDGQWHFRRGYSWKNAGEFPTQESVPVGNVTWHDAKAFCEWLSTKEPGRRYRLPTEAEWEYACRAGRADKWCFGEVENPRLRQFAWYLPNSGNRPHLVGQKSANAFGLFDMHGNLSEWVSDRFQADGYKPSPNQTIDPKGPSVGVDRVMRGGNFRASAAEIRSAARQGVRPNSPAGGFRVVLEIGD